MIEFVTLENCHSFEENPLSAQHRLRYQSIIVRQAWDVPCYNEMEFDQYDNPASKYLIYRDENRIARGVSRLYPTILPYMLEASFSSFVTSRSIPKSEDVWEGSRFCIDQNLPAEERRRIAQMIVIGYLEVGLQFNLSAIVGLMYPIYWKNLFIKSGWEVDFMGEVTALNDGNKARSGWLHISEDVLENVRRVTGISQPVVNFGSINENSKLRVA